MSIRCALFSMLIMLFCAAPLPAHAADVPAAPMTVAKFDDGRSALPPTPDVQRDLKVNEKYDYYEIQGETAADLRKQMRMNGTRWNDGKTYAALTTWNIKYDFDVDHSNDKYSIRSVRTNIDVVFHLPRFLQTATTPKVLAGQWGEYMEHLMVHELGHRELAVNSAARINNMLAALGSFNSRNELDSVADRQVTAELRHMKQQQVEYDAHTSHGEKQGAILE